MKSNENNPMVDALLEEWLGNQKPNPVSLNELGMRRVDPQRAAELDQALQGATTDLRNRTLASSAAMYRKRKTYSPAFRVLATLAACLVIGVGAWAIVNRDQLEFQKLRQGKNLPVFANDNAVSTPKSEKGNSSSVASSEKKTLEAIHSDKAMIQKDKREALPLDSLPFHTQESIATQSKSSVKPANAAEKLDERAIVKLIDRGMLQVWNNHDAMPAAPIPGVAWVERAVKQLLSRSATPEEKDSFAKKDSLDLRLDLLHRIVESPEFSQVWAKRIADFYLDVESGLPREVTPERRAFVQWIRKEINQTRRLDTVVKNIVLAEGIGSSAAELPASAHWWSELGSRNKTAPAEIIVSKFMGNRASCSRCHDARTVASADQSRFWGVAAIVNGIEVSQSGLAQKPTVQFRSNAAPLFYERSDATMFAALPALPDGHKLKTPEGNANQQATIAKQNLAALSDWVVQSDELSRTHVDFVWKSLFGQPLVGNYPLDESEGRRERLELANAIGQQLQSNEYDLRKLVTWIAASQVFGLESLTPESSNGNWYLTATAKDLSQFRRRQMLFAAFPARQEPSFRSIEKLASWFDASKALGNERGKILANPLPSKAPSTKSTKPVDGNATRNNDADEISSAQVQYLINAQLLPKAIQAEVDKMVQSNLAWNVLVDHAFFMTGSTLPSQADREAAQRILDISRDKRLAVSRIIAARL